ncbi:acetate--CoA ligase [Chitinimonas sp. BJB300]|uniref:acetate--CoA ligase n=1 Tax=Chitinimonas sp. BJB300 TaxID=1559339 RepID=UPI000C0F7838|nr:acetate--CoA ligase [Chitinimonas sp. BJB300]PHV11267.1 acetate--CoA ligase [Chitinimonas sp. BJB300]TSJ90796.1 acetate--CoA ligase [Chitinimonas sp. BJB300]
MSTIDSILKETRVFPPSDDFRRSATISGMDTYKGLCEQAGGDYLAFWGSLARELITWQKPFSRVLDDTNAPFFKWFDDGVLNVSYNCLDRHLPQNANKTAIIFEADDGAVTRVTYAELHRRVCQFANGLRSLGVARGERVVIYMPMSIEAVVAMQACARIGAIHSVVFGGFSAKSVQERIVDAGAVAVITANEGMRGGKAIPLKTVVDDAYALGNCSTIKHTIVYQRTSNGTSQWQEGRDIWWHKLTEGQAENCETEWMGADDPLFILYTSGSTGKPKGIQHSSAGYLLGAMNSFRWVFDIKPDDVFWCTADVGWITGHSYVCYGPLGMAATQVIFEGVPTYPDAHRFWQMIERHKVSIFYTAPTAIRSLIKLGADFPKHHDLSSLRLLGTVGEPINPEAWIWYHEVVGKGRCPIVDTWWQTETGSIMISPLPGAVATKPGSCTLPLPGVIADIVDESGATVEPGKGGMLVIKKPFPSLVRTIWGDPERFKKTYFPEEFNGKYYLAGDSANRDEHGYFWIMGRIDDVLNVSGHRLGTMEIESALVANPLVAEAAVVGKPHEIKGEAVVAFVVLKGPRPSGEDAKKMVEQLKNWVAQEIGKIAQPDDIRFGDNLPKTRSGKIMRRLLRAIARGEKITQDTSTLENPAILQQLQEPAA